MILFNLKLGLYSILITTIFYISIRANDPFLQQIIDYFNNLQSEFPIEKVHLHIDSDVYTLGDDIWFSAYLTAGSTQLPSPLSKTLYVHLFNSEGFLISKKTILLENGFGHGDFKLPDFGPEGIYSIKAYTSWMENFGEEYFFHQEIKVFDGSNLSFYPDVKFLNISSDIEKVKYEVQLDVLDSKGIPLSNAKLRMSVLGDSDLLTDKEIILNNLGQASLTFSIPHKAYIIQKMELEFQENESYIVKKKVKIPYSIQFADIQFLPEGGRLVKGYKSTIAFKGIFPDGSPADFEGEVLSTGEPIRFKTFFGGMGKFEFTPNGQTTQVRIKDKEYDEFIYFNLPEAKDLGLVLKLINNQNQSYVTVYLEGNLKDESLTIVSHSRALINYIGRGSLPNGIWSTRIPKRNLQQGINHVTILNQDGIPLVERIFFHWNEDEKFDIEVAKQSEIKPRSTVVLEIGALLNNVPHEGRFSMSVTDLDQLPTLNNTNNSILTNLLLTSDLRGQIIMPNHFFRDKEESTLMALDLVMLTNGWRRFDWEDVFTNTFPKINKQIEQGVNIYGEVKSINNSRRGLKGGTVGAIIGRGEAFASTSFGEDGKFIIPNLLFFDDTPITFSAKDERQQEFLEIEVQQQGGYFDHIPEIIPDFTIIPKYLIETFAARQMMSKLLDGEKLIDLQEFEIKSESLDKENLDQRRIYGQGDVTIVPEKIPGSKAFVNIFEMIQGRVAGVQVTVSGMNASVSIRGPSSINASTEPFFLLDNIPVDIATLMQVNPRDVEAIDIFKDPLRTSIFGSQGANGAIAIYTKSGIGLVGTNSIGNLNSMVKGYSIAREFYQPAYESKNLESWTTDKRKTIYWNPNIKLDTESKTDIKFFNTDIAKKLLVIIEGMDSSGRITRIEKIIE